MAPNLMGISIQAHRLSFSQRPVMLFHLSTKLVSVQHPCNDKAMLPKTMLVGGGESGLVTGIGRAFGSVFV